MLLRFAVLSVWCEVLHVAVKELICVSRSAHFDISPSMSSVSVFTTSLWSGLIQPLISCCAFRHQQTRQSSKWTMDCCRSLSFMNWSRGDNNWCTKFYSKLDVTFWSTVWHFLRNLPALLPKGFTWSLTGFKAVLFFHGWSDVLTSFCISNMINILESKSNNLSPLKPVLVSEENVFK